MDAKFRESFGVVLDTFGGAASDALGRERFGLIVCSAGVQRLSDGVEPDVEIVVHPAHLIFEACEHVRQVVGLCLRRGWHSAKISSAADREAV
ncbi:MAG TPA: hypothetical protein VMF09_09445 [Solirubrobacteraceae bacterium]|nr:hypothetical protein [Solirubrobacteraceae bacterium]